jgi:hypothetical protein
MNKGYVYKIFDNTNNNVYYGSTKQGLSKRLSKHRGDYKFYLNGNGHFMTSYKILENGDYTISLVEEVKYNDKIELTARERFYIESNECVNKVIPNRTRKQWREDNKDKLKEQIKEWRETNKEQIKTYNKEYIEDNKEHIKEQKREYRETNKDHIKEYNRQYREANKDKIKEKNKEYNEANKEKIREYYKQYNEAKKLNK